MDERLNKMYNIQESKRKGQEDTTINELDNQDGMKTLKKKIKMRTNNLEPDEDVDDQEISDLDEFGGEEGEERIYDEDGEFDDEEGEDGEFDDEEGEFDD